MDSGLVEITEREQELLFAFIKGVTGNVHNVESRADVLLRSVERLIERSRFSNLQSYLRFVTADEQALVNFISTTTNHTTSWFRECEHFETLYETAQNHAENTSATGDERVVYTVASLGCSSGQEVYSAALVLEAVRRQNAFFNYQIVGLDIDRHCLTVARRAIYPVADIRRIPEKYHSLILQGSDSTDGWFTLDKEIRSRCTFRHGNFTHSEVFMTERCFDTVFIRNVLLYLANETVDEILRLVHWATAVGGALFVAHSESFLVSKKQFSPARVTGGFIKRAMEVVPDVARCKRVLVVEDSKTVQAVLAGILQMRGFGVDCVDCKDALNLYLMDMHTPDIISLDLHMPGFDGAKWLEQFRLTDARTPVIVVSSLYADDARPVLDMLSTGAQDYIEKSGLHSDPDSVAARFEALTNDSKHASKACQLHELVDINFSPELVLIGASTGGVRALRETLRALPRSLPPVVVVQHISADFGAELARHMAKVTGLEIGTTDQTTRLKKGHLYIATGDFHLSVRSLDNELYVVPKAYPEGQFRPSVDVLFSSVSRTLANRCVGILLTGMGSDGVEGMGKLKRNGAVTIAQDYHSSVVHGMPGEAIRLNYANFVSEPRNIRDFLFNCTVAPADCQTPPARQCFQDNKNEKNILSR